VAVLSGVVPEIAIIRATTADERGNLTYEHEGAYLGALDQALAAHNNGGIVIAQVKRLAQAGTLKPHDVHVPGILVDHIVIAPDQLQTTQTAYDPAISGEIFRPLDSFRLPGFDVAKTIARRVALELRAGWAVNLGFGISANVPRILLEEGRHGAVTWVIEQGAGRRRAAARLPVRLRLQCRGHPALPASVHLFPGRRLRRLAALLPADRPRGLGQCLLPALAPHVTAGAGGFVDITAQAKRIVFSGYFNAGAKLAVADGAIRIEREGKVKKLVPEVDHVSFSAGARWRRARRSPMSPSAAS
jgi:Acyl CoA:acetate/3-ketoacid CoA transferase